MESSYFWHIVTSHTPGALSGWVFNLWMCRNASIHWQQVQSLKMERQCWITYHYTHAHCSVVRLLRMHAVRPADVSIQEPPTALPKWNVWGGFWAAPVQKFLLPEHHTLSEDSSAVPAPWTHAQCAVANWATGHACSSGEGASTSTGTNHPPPWRERKWWCSNGGVTGIQTQTECHHFRLNYTS